MSPDDVLLLVSAIIYTCDQDPATGYSKQEAIDAAIDLRRMIAENRPAMQGSFAEGFKPA